MQNVCVVTLSVVFSSVVFRVFVVSGKLTSCRKCGGCPKLG